MPDRYPIDLGQAERWRAIKISTFEHRQIEALGKELAQDCEARTGPDKPASNDATHKHIFGSNEFPFEGSCFPRRDVSVFGYAFTEDGGELDIEMALSE